MGDLVKFNVLEEKILELYAQGKTKDVIAIELDIPITEVNKVFRKPKVKEKLQEIIEHREILLKEKHLEILDRITDEMLKKAMESGDLLSIFNKNRDLLDVIAITNQITKEQEKKRLGTSGNNVLVQILNQLGDADE